LPAPELTRDPLGFFGKTLKESFLFDEKDEQDIYYFKN